MRTGWPARFLRATTSDQAETPLWGNIGGRICRSRSQLVFSGGNFPVRVLALASTGISPLSLSALAGSEIKRPTGASRAACTVSSDLGGRGSQAQSPHARGDREEKHQVDQRFLQRSPTNSRTAVTRGRDIFAVISLDVQSNEQLSRRGPSARELRHRAIAAKRGAAGVNWKFLIRYISSSSTVSDISRLESDI